MDWKQGLEGAKALGRKATLAAAESVPGRAAVGQAKELVGKATGLVSAQAGAFTGLTQRAAETVTDEATAALDQCWPNVQQAFHDHLQRPAAVALYDDEWMNHILPVIYDGLPTVVRLVVQEKVFVRVCLNNRHRLLLPIDDG